MDISIIIPAYNEEKSIKQLYSEIKKALDPLRFSYHVVFIDDGSTDGTFSVVRDMSAGDEEKIKIIRFVKNHGKASALAAGVREAVGDLIITMDADCQNDPSQMHLFIEKIKEGYDFVIGWRFKRQDNILKVLLSKLFNAFLSITCNTSFHDVNCGFKAFKRGVVNERMFTGGNHRLLPVLLEGNGVRVAEIKIAHFRRKFDKSKYHIFRFIAFFNVIKIVARKRLTP